MEKVKICINLNKVDLSKRQIDCMKRGIIRSWYCPLFNKTAKCKFLDILEIPRKHVPEKILEHLVDFSANLSLCERCIFGVQTVANGRLQWYCSYKKRMIYGERSKCPWFQERKAKKQYANQHTANTLERWLK